MKPIILLLISLCLNIMLQAQVSKTVNSTAGSLSTALTAAELSTVTNLAITGTIDARDFKTMRDNMPLLAELDLSGTTIVAYAGYGGTSSEIDAYPANEIPQDAFHGTISNKTIIKSIMFPSSISSIGDRAFFGCSGLKETLILPSFVRDIGMYSFFGCSGLVSVSIPSSVRNIGYGAFYNCSGLSGTLALPSSITSIENLAFSGCSGLTGTLSIPSSVKDIGMNSFNGCSGLTTVSIPPSVTNIGYGAFFNCAGLSGTLIIPSSVISIGSWAFGGGNRLTSVTIPSSVHFIGEGAFSNSHFLTSIYANSIIPIDLISSPQVFYGVNTVPLYVPYGSSALYAAADQWKDFLNIEEIPGFKLSASTANIAAPEGSTAGVEVSANVAWTASSDQIWLTVSPNSGTGNHALTFTAKANPLNTTRTATVTVSSTGVESQTIVVTQEAGIANKLPVANAGSDQTVTEGDLVTLNGTGSYDQDNNSLSFPWTAPGNIQLNSPIAIKVTVTGPPVTTTRSHDFSLMLYDGSPTATPGNNSFKFNWTIPSGITFSSSTVSIITISPPNTTHANYTFAIKVLDGSNTSDPWHNGMTYFSIPPTDFVMSPTTIVKLSISGTESTTLTNQNFSMEVSDATPSSGTVLLTKNWPMPAGTNLGPTTDVILTITSPNGTANPDYKFLLEFKNGSTLQNQLTYKWTAPSGIILSSTTDPNPTFIAPEVNTVIDYTFSLVVNNGIVDSPPDAVVIRVNNTNTYQPISSVWNGNSLDHMNIKIYSAELLVLVNPNDRTSSQKIDNSVQFKCYPNPFAEEINLEIENPQQNKVSVSIFNLAGQCIKNLLNENTNKLVYLSWNGTNNLGHQVTPGVYVCRVNNRSKQIILGR